MINLLPRQAQLSLLRQYRSRALALGLFAVAWSFLAGGIVLAAFYINASARLSAVTASSAEGSKETGGEAGATATLDAASKLLRAVPKAPAESVSDLIDEVVRRRPEGLTLTSFTFGKSGPDTRLEVAGEAPTRSDLITFEHALEDAPMFAAVELPISNLARDQEIPFTLTITLAEETP